MMRTPNPHYIGAPARMADGRLFTDYRAACALLPAYKNVPWADWERIQNMQRLGVARIQNDRAQASLVAGTSNCADTMVPELTKWTADWTDAQQQLYYPVGIGAGRNPLPGSAPMTPDKLAAATFPLSMLPGSYEQKPLNLPGPHKVVDTVPAAYNRYSLPYGN